MGRTRIDSSRYLLPIPGFSQAVRPAAPGVPLFVSGLTARGAHGELRALGDAAGQARTILEALRGILAEAGGTLDDVVRTVTYLTDMRDYDAIHAVRREFFGELQPASTTIQVSRLYDLCQRIEIEATAIIAPRTSTDRVTDPCDEA